MGCYGPNLSAERGQVELPDVASPGSLREPGNAEQSGGAQAVTRALSVLACFRGGTPDLGVSDIARMLDLTTSTTHRLIRTLVNAGFLERDPRTSRYRLGNALAEYGQIVYRQRRVYVAEPHVRHLSLLTGENVALAVRHGSDALLLTGAQAAWSESQRVTGIRIPLHSTAMGKVLIAWADEFEGDPTRIGPLTAVTPRTITDPAVLRRELERTRSVGYALNDEEMTPGIRTVAVPILDDDGHALFALAVRGPLDHMTNKRIPSLIDLARNTAEEIRLALMP
jgi:IclR family transcriptional regulator, acetate operon repressor